MKRFAVLACALLVFTTRRLFAQEDRPPVSGESRPEVQSYSLPPEKYQQAVDYSRQKYRLHFAGAAYGLGLIAGVLALKLAPRFRNLAESASRRRWVQAAVFAPLLTLTLDALQLPLSVYSHRLSLRYQQSVQGWGSWFRDWMKGVVLGAVLSAFVVWLLYAVIRRSPDRWWLYFWLASIPLIVFMLFITPLVIEPLFFRFEPLAPRHPALASAIREVAARGGLDIPEKRMFEMKASEKLKSVNAYVSGIGASKRVVVWDTTLERMSIPETLFVFGHELGHYVMGHIPRTIAFTSVLLLGSLFAGFIAVRRTVDRFGERWEIRGVEDWASLPVLLLYLGIFGFLGEPVVNAYSRWQERQADVFGLEVIQGIVPEPGAAGARAFQTLGEINLADPNPDPFIKIWLYSHPPVDERIRFARQYKPWVEGGPGSYLP